MAAGRAVVASDVPGNAGLLGRDGSRGLLYPVDASGDGELLHSVSGCADAIARLEGGRTRGKIAVDISTGEVR